MGKVQEQWACFFCVPTVKCIWHIMRIKLIARGLFTYDKVAGKQQHDSFVLDLL